ncbi:hypothetical protein [Mesorhizobium sp.]|uniref:hypothetical protein n=1 Tax=Mesorhizobium sp. TaxID=1871066 RepID=UPI0025C2C0CF|nr:hypothetical protein [Mesorhizobium sp.]
MIEMIVAGASWAKAGTAASSKGAAISNVDRSVTLRFILNALQSWRFRSIRL